MNLNSYMIGQRIQHYRKVRELSQQTLSEMIGKSPTYISHIETGKRTMSLDTFTDICNALDINADKLLYENLKSPSPAANELSAILKDCTKYERIIIVDTIKGLKSSLRTNEHLTRQKTR